MAFLNTWQELGDWVAQPEMHIAIRILAMVVVGLPALTLASSFLGRLCRRRFSEQAGMLANKGFFYLGFLLIAVMIMNEMGFQLGAVLGAAGVAGVAIGFASQTSLSNVISGLFLVGEKPFIVGDAITVGGTTGVVLSIDLMSVKLRTFDNKYVRIPNETMIKTEVTNITRFPIRRFDITFGIAYRYDITRVTAILKELAEQNPYALNDPEPIIVLTGFTDTAVTVLFGIWFAKEDFLALRNSITNDIKVRFEAEGIEMPYPRMALNPGPMAAPFTVRMAPEPSATNVGPTPTGEPTPHDEGTV